MNEKSIPWDDLRIVLAIAGTGSLSGACRRLGVSHATVFRRLGEIERRLGVELFHRARSGYTPTPAGEDVAAVAERIETEVLAVERRVAGRDLRPSGTVRVTTTDTLLYGLLSALFAGFRQSFPAISLEIAVSNQLFSLSRREADLAIRPSDSPPETLVGRRLGGIAQAVYGQHGLVRVIGDGDALERAGWVGPDTQMGYRALEDWMIARGVHERCHYRVDTLMGVLAAVREGIGIAVLPCYLGDADESLVRIGGPIPELETGLWLLTHPDLRQVGRVRALFHYIGEESAAVRARLAGDS